jgi:integrase
MRFNELFGLSISALFKGKITNESLAAELEKCDIDYIGYIYLLDQIDNDRKVREADGSLARIPLKSYKTISPKHARIIPIRTKEVWNILAKRYKAEQARLLKRTYTTNKADYVFFDDLTWSDATATIKGAYKSTGIKPKTYHCCRHSYTTMLVGETRSFFLTRMITGHKKDKSFEKYLHIFEMISMEAASKEQDIDIV